MRNESAAQPKVSVPFSCLYKLFEYQASRIPDAPAVLALDRAPLSYGRLYRHIVQIGHSLRALGIGPSGRIAVVLPNGPELAVAIVSVASNAACAVVNAAYAADELERYFDDLRPDGLITQAGLDSPARRIAVARSVRVLDLSAVRDAEAGLFTLSANEPGEPSLEPIGPGDVALLLFTSGTTSRPKIVPLTHVNVCTSAYSTVAALALKETDRCLNVLPLFHGHGLFATVIASLAAGASVVCTPGCDVNRFFAWLIAFKPTWYSAVPTMHQAILAQARLNPDHINGHQLRLVRSASAPLPPRVLAELERIFKTAVIEFYGMTETASAPIACNPLPPRRRKPGSVGIPVGLDVAIVNNKGGRLPGGQTGQVVVRGPSVMPGYDGDPAATQAAYAGDWFNTGDQGFFDEDGYLFLSGRTREMINRGGENIAPREVDEALLEHPAIAEAVTFAVPHATLGEDIAAAVVLRPATTATPRDIRQFARVRLAAFKVPRQVLIVKEIPKGPTGKVQRVGLAAKFGFASADGLSPPFIAPQTPLENVLAGIWAEVLHVDRVGIHDDFFALGGDSLLATHVLTCIHDTLHINVEVSGLFDAPTVAEMARHLETLIQAGHARRPNSDIAPAVRGGGMPTSPPQERLWTLQQALSGLPFFNILSVLRINSPLDVKVLERSINAIVQRHEILRTTFAFVDDRPVQVIAPHQTVTVAFNDLLQLPKFKRQAAGDRLIQDELTYSFDLAQGPLLRVRVIRLAGAEHFLLITMHQIIVDGWSLGVLVDELAALYQAFAAGVDSPLAPLSLQYADFASWQRDWRSHPDIVSQFDYWRDRLRDPPPVMTMSAPNPKRTADTLLTAQRAITLPAHLAEAVKQFGHREGGTLFIALVAALKTLLCRSFGETDLCVATNVANRNKAGTEGLIGPLANTVILRTDLGGDPTVREVMRRVRATTLGAYAQQDLPFEDLAEILKQERGVELPDLAQVMILLHNASLRPLSNSARTFAYEDANPDMPQPLVTTTTYNVILALRETEGGLAGSCLYKPHLFSAKFIDRLLQDFRTVLETIVAQPERPISTIDVNRKTSAELLPT